MNIVHFCIIRFELRLQPVHGATIIGEIGYNCVACCSISLCQWVMSTWPEGVGCLHALLTIIRSLNVVISQGLEYFEKWPVVRLKELVSGSWKWL